jgi:hypothetical protein
VLNENAWFGCQMPGEAAQGGNAAGERECEADGSEQAVDGGERAAGEAHFAAGPGESDPSATATEPGVRRWKASCVISGEFHALSGMFV